MEKEFLDRAIFNSSDSKQRSKKINVAGTADGEWVDVQQGVVQPAWESDDESSCMPTCTILLIMMRESANLNNKSWKICDFNMCSMAGNVCMMPTNMVDFAKQSAMNYLYGADVENGLGLMLDLLLARKDSTKP
jgi:hypothetical protein